MQPLDENPYADWSAHIFAADRTQYILLSNTKSLYSTILYGKGITNDSQFLDRVLSSIREFMQDDGQQFAYHRFIAPWKWESNRGPGRAGGERVARAEKGATATGRVLR